jgi:transposase-like protein
MKVKSLERKRYSIIYDDLTKCAECKTTFRVEKNEVYEGSKRVASMKNGFVVPLCQSCHSRFHNDRQFALKYKMMFQRAYELEHSREEFLNLIHRSYL